MRPFSASDLLGIWENGLDRAPVGQALVILKTAFPGAADATLEKLTIGLRDAYLLHLRELTFGPPLNGLADCPGCGERLELTFDTYDLPVPDFPLPDLETVEPQNGETPFRLDSFEVTYRLPTSADLISPVAPTDISRVQQRLVEACVVSVVRDGTAATARDLPAGVLKALIERMEEAEPLANVTISAGCPSCGHRWQIIFDIVSYFWSEINAWAMRLMREVHVLASAYGWSEADILAMSACRRQRYLELIGT
jgi:hypothetical protein